MNAEQYLRKLAKQIKNHEVRGEIMKEYEEHIMDIKEALIDSGLPEKEAEEEAVRQMGDPQEAGIKMNRVYHKLLDWDMFAWMMGAYVFAVALILIYHLLTQAAFKNGISITSLGEGIPYAVNRGIAIVLATYGTALSIFEKYTGKPLFYNYARDWGRCYFANSGFMFVLSTVFLYKNPVQSLCIILSYCALQLFLRAFMTLLQERKESQFLYETGVAGSEISYKGKGTFGDHRVKVRAKDSAKGTRIQPGAPIMVIELEGFCPIVVQM